MGVNIATCHKFFLYAQFFSDINREINNLACKLLGGALNQI